MADAPTAEKECRASSSARAHSCQQVVATQTRADAASHSKPCPDCATLITAPCLLLQPGTRFLKSVASTMLSLQANAMPKHWDPKLTVHVPDGIISIPGVFILDESCSTIQHWRWLCKTRDFHGGWAPPGECMDERAGRSQQGAWRASEWADGCCLRGGERAASDGTTREVQG